ncbi:hypothetical protein [Nocardioides dilutus]
MTTTRQVVAVLAAVTLGIAIAGCGDDDTGTGGTTEPSVTTTEPTDTSTEPTDTTEPTEPTELEQPALWPAADVVFDDPVAAAQDFLDNVLEAGTAGEFRQGDARSGEVDALFSGESGDRSIVRSTLLLRQLGSASGWFVIAAVNPNAAITVPESLAEVPAGPLTVEGIGRGFEAHLTVSAQVSGTTGEPLDVQIAQGGSEATPLPFTTTLDLSGAAPGDVVTIMVRGGTGIETDPGEFGAIPVVIAD